MAASDPPTTPVCARLNVAEEILDQELEALALYGLADSQVDPQQTIDSYIRSVELAREADNQRTEALALRSLGDAYYDQASYSQAIDAYQQSLTLSVEIGDVREQGRNLNSLGNLYSQLGAYDQAIDSYLRSIEIARTLSDIPSEGSALLGLGSVYSIIGDRNSAYRYWQRALEIAQDIEVQSLEAKVLGVLGENNPEDMIAAARENEDWDLELFGWVMKGLNYQNSRDYRNALDAYQQALGIAQRIGDREQEGIIFHYFGLIAEQQRQIELAIIYYKKSVNVREGIRYGIQDIEQSLQQRYTETVAGTYRNLASLLLEKGRILEAQMVLELLKIEELREYTRGRVIDVESRRIDLSPAEEEISRDFDGLIEFGKEIATCEATMVQPCDDLYDQRRALTHEFNNTVESFISEVNQRSNQDPSALNPEDFVGEANDILAVPGTVLIYPVVLKDKLWILWATSGGVVNSVEVPVSQHQLGNTVLCFRQLLDNPYVNSCETYGQTTVQEVSQDLYRYLVPPQLELEFTHQEIQNLVFSLDQVTRYIPITALHDGENYLIQRFTISTVLSAGLTRRDNPLPTNIQETSILALGLSEAVPENPLENIPEFDELFHVPAELNGIMAIYSGQRLLNRDFGDRAFYQLPNHQVLHIATHGKFVPSRQEQSYLMLGTKQPFRIRQIEDIKQFFSDLSMVVLSACETALGAPDQDGIEINGLAHSFIRAGTNTVIASLWQVNDGSTSLLMQQFYKALANPNSDIPITIAQALRQAQLSFLDGTIDPTLIEEYNRGLVEWGDSSESSINNSYNAVPDLSHPYYWAPFVIIGNGL